MIIMLRLKMCHLMVTLTLYLKPHQILTSIK
jgi:hypothetical protein